MKILILTSTRADYGYLRPIIQRLQSSKIFKPVLMVSGTHLSKKYGRTISQIYSDGIPIKYKRRIYGHFFKEPYSVMVNFISVFISFFINTKRTKPTLVLLFGDRYEMLAAACAATLLKTPIVHMAGGEISLGSNDNQIRHAISKMAHVHFVMSHESKQRLIQMGEDPTKVFNAGNTSLENLNDMKFLSREKLQEKYQSEFATRILLITFHPVTNLSDNGKAELRELLDALSLLDESYFFVITGANIDYGSKTIRQEIAKFCSENQEKTLYVESLGSEDYFSFLRISDACVGNSSSGLYEAPKTNTATINIGVRQLDRDKPNSVIDVAANRDEIYLAIKSIEKKSKKEIQVEGSTSPPSKIIVEKLEEICDFSSLLIKPFYSFENLRNGKSDTNG